MTAPFIPGRDTPDGGGIVHSNPQYNVGELPDWQGIDVVGANGRLTKISYGYAIAQGWAPAGLTKDQYINQGWTAKVQRTYYDWSLGNSIGGSRGSGSGPAGPVYQAPDSGFVRENIKAYVVATTGKAHDDVIDAATNEYLRQDKARFQAAEADAAEDIDPMLSAYGVVRNSKWYTALHDGRPDSVDEMEWVVERQRKLRNLGLNAQTAEDLGIDAAQGSFTDEGLVGAANVAQMGDTGRMLRQHREELKSRASAAMRLI